MSQKSYLGRFAEGFCFLVILLGVMQTFAAGYAALTDSAAHYRKAMILSGFAVDLVFCAEFLARAVMSGKRRGFFAYMIHEGGFVDFVISFPLIAFLSGPLVFSTVFPAKTGSIALIVSSLGGLRVYGAVKADRIVHNLVFARILKLARILKFSRGSCRRSPMTPFFVAKAFSLPVAAVVLVLIGFCFIDGGEGSQRTEAYVDLLAASVTLCTFLLATIIFRSFFKKHVTGVIAPMLRGFKTAEYSTEVRIDAAKSSFETYQIADQYNRKWLPVKRKILEAKRGRKAADG
jgi:uncharacterized membrane protein YozB (DUF420 family)